ncbi:hypothetical protein [Pseudorhodoplanes sp.]|uniref:hypothetical protein n=1 Tax=Pseudorhodoplanes sp. TaxID=1934341 RepID=UPI002BB8DD32|nr:hypothetical protein [Pseudorhodoplanes sp.]HWV40974.1 hypothetical protein [Pseudorhodoplanes sp.]
MAWLAIGVLKAITVQHEASSDLGVIGAVLLIMIAIKSERSGKGSMLAAWRETSHIPGTRHLQFANVAVPLVHNPTVDRF